MTNTLRSMRALAAGAALLALGSTAAQAGVSPEEAAKLKSELMPLGGERAGNKDGSIPAWTGGYTTPIPGDEPQGRRGDPFKSEKPLLSISAKNMAQYADQLTDGVKALMAKYPAYRIDVFKTQRTAAAPQFVYDNTFKNATRAKLVGDNVEGAFGGIPFPVPKSGGEVMWNHLMRWQGTAWSMRFTQYQTTPDGRRVLTTDGVAEQQAPYYFEDGSPEQFEKAGGDYWLLRLVNAGPPIRAGEALVVRLNRDSSKDQSWLYLAGQRRVRKLPNGCCDTPTPATAGLMSFDEVMTWYGSLDRFDWKLLGKREMYIPYNNNRMLAVPDDQVLGANYLNPDFVRWELHRVWVVESTLRQGKRHQVGRSRYYCDEDTWQCVLADRWDSRGQLWKTIWSGNFVAPEFPGTVTFGFGFTDLISGTSYAANLFGSKAQQYVKRSRFSDSVFTPDAMAGEGVR